jgi:hypothetical protein
VRDGRKESGLFFDAGAAGSERFLHQCRFTIIARQQCRTGAVAPGMADFPKAT